MYFSQVGQMREEVLVAKRGEDDPMVTQRRESGIDSHFLPSTRATGGNEDTSILAGEGTSSPETTSGIPEGLSCIYKSAFVILSIRRDR